ncbi:hypothetical protein ACFQ9X_48775 [Catenulispora yoronensis]
MRLPQLGGLAFGGGRPGKRRDIVHVPRRNHEHGELGAAVRAPGGPTTGTSSGSQPIAPSSPGGSSSSSPAKPDPSAQVKYVSPQGVTLASDGVTLIAEVTWGGCSDQPQLVVMSQDASKVVVELKETSHARIGVMCPDIARNGEASVKLVAPLGTRQVIDGIKNAPINVH